MYIYILYIYIYIYIYGDCSLAEMYEDLCDYLFQKLKYLFNFYNIIVWILVVTTIMFISTTSLRCLMQWRAGWMAFFLAWMNFIMYLRR